jgi:hypothetical protein
MAEQPVRPDEQAPAAGEPVHLPGPSYLPVLVAAGTSMAVVGIVIWWVLVVIGAIVMLIPLARWIRQTREEMAELPLEH